MATDLLIDDSLTVGSHALRSRLIVGTGKYRDFAQNAAALAASGAEIVTVAVRRVNVSDPSAPMLTDFIDPARVTYLPNTAGCFTADEAVRTLRLAREAGGWDLVKLEVLGEARTLYPDMRETLKATDVLVKEGFKPMVYCTDDPIAAKQLEEAGAVAIMPLGAPIGSGLGIQNRVTIRLIVEGASVPVRVDASVAGSGQPGPGDELGTLDDLAVQRRVLEREAAVGAGHLPRLAEIEVRTRLSVCWLVRDDPDEAPDPRIALNLLEQLRGIDSPAELFRLRQLVNRVHSLHSVPSTWVVLPPTSPLNPT